DEWPMGEAITRALLLGRAQKRSAKSPPPPVIIDAVTAGLLDARFQTAPLDDDSLALLAEHEADETRPLLGRPTACVGREAELGILEANIDSCIDEETPHVVMVLGQPGVGKSRLRHEFLRRLSCRSEKPEVLFARGELHAAGTPFRLLRQALLQLSGVHPT